MVNLKNLIEKKKTTVRALAREAGISDSYVYYLRRGERRASKRVEAALAKALNVTVDELYKAHNYENKIISKERLEVMRRNKRQFEERRYKRNRYKNKRGIGA